MCDPFFLWVEKVRGPNEAEGVKKVIEPALCDDGRADQAKAWTHWRSLTTLGVTKLGRLPGMRTVTKLDTPTVKLGKHEGEAEKNTHP